MSARPKFPKVLYVVLNTDGGGEGFWDAMTEPHHQERAQPMARYVIDEAGDLVTYQAEFHPRPATKRGKGRRARGRR